jgi:hypothetical protein
MSGMGVAMSQRRFAVVSVVVLGFFPLFLVDRATAAPRPTIRLGQTQQTTPEVTSFIINNLTLGEVDKKLEEQGVPKDARDKVVRAEKERRERNSKKLGGDVHTLSYSGAYDVNCAERESCMVTWESDGPARLSSHFYNDLGGYWTAWQDLDCPFADGCRVISTAKGDWGYLWGQFEAWNSMWFNTPVITGHDCF